MKKSGINLAILIWSAGMISCGQQGEVITTPSGLTYNLLESGSAEIGSGEMMLVSFVATDVEDSVWMDSRPMGCQDR